MAKRIEAADRLETLQKEALDVVTDKGMDKLKDELARLEDKRKALVPDMDKVRAGSGSQKSLY